MKDRVQFAQADKQMAPARRPEDQAPAALDVPNGLVVIGLRNAQVLLDMQGLEVLRELGPLQRTRRDGLFHEDSLLYKSLGNTLTDEQLARFEALEAERRAARHRSSIERALAQLTRGEPPLREAQRRDLIKLLSEEIKPPPYDLHYTLFMMRRLPEGRLKPLFGDEQWPAVTRQINQIRQMEGALRQRGLLPDEDGDGAPAVPPPPAVLKK